jgi:hypothetical protein
MTSSGILMNFDPAAIRNFEGSLSGPVVKDNLFFYLNGRYYYNTGYLFGRRQFLTTDMPQAADLIIPYFSGDNKFVSYES